MWIQFKIPSSFVLSFVDWLKGPGPILVKARTVTEYMLNISKPCISIVRSLVLLDLLNEPSVMFTSYKIIMPSLFSSGTSLQVTFMLSKVSDTAETFCGASFGSARKPKYDMFLFSRPHIAPNWRCLVYIVLIIGSFSNDHCDGKEDVKKAIGLLRKTTTLHVRHAFLYISLPSLHDYDVKMPNFKFYGRGKQATTNIFFSL